MLIFVFGFLVELGISKLSERHCSGGGGIGHKGERTETRGRLLQARLSLSATSASRSWSFLRLTLLSMSEASKGLSGF